MIQLLVLVPAVLAAAAAMSCISAYHWLSKPLVDDGRIYVCSDNNFFSFESNGSIAWTVHMDYKCNAGMASVHGGPGKIYLVADNRILKIKFEKIGTSERAAEVFFGREPSQQVEAEIIGLSVSTLSSTVFINIKNRGLFAYRSNGRLLWSVGPVLYKYGYRQGCRKNLTDCYFASVLMLDQCEASMYISNTDGQLYCLSIRGHHFRWMQDFSYLDRNFSIIPGNNGHLYLAFPVKTLVLALDVFSGHNLWQRSIRPLSKADCAPVVDSNETGNLLQCRTLVSVLSYFSGEKLTSSCSQARTKLISIYAGNERVIVLFLLFESTVLALLIRILRFCCIFWGKKKLQDKGLGSFLSKRCSLQLKKKALDRTITELEQKAEEEAVGNEVLQKLGDIVQERECIERKLLTTYNLGRGRTDLHAQSVLPLHKRRKKSHSFQGATKKNMTMFHTLTDTSSSEDISEREIGKLEGMESSTKAGG